MNREEALKWIAELFEEPVENIQPGTAREAIPMWDSLGVLTLMAELDERFQIALTTDAVLAMCRVDDILSILEDHDKLN